MTDLLVSLLPKTDPSSRLTSSLFVPLQLSLSLSFTRVMRPFFSINGVTHDLQNIGKWTSFQLNHCAQREGAREIGFVDLLRDRNPEISGSNGDGSCFKKATTGNRSILLRVEVKFHVNLDHTNTFQIIYSIRKIITCIVQGSILFC